MVITEHLLRNDWPSVGGAPVFTPMYKFVCICESLGEFYDCVCVFVGRSGITSGGISTCFWVKRSNIDGFVAVLLKSWKHLMWCNPHTAKKHSFSIIREIRPLECEVMEWYGKKIGYLKIQIDRKLKSTIFLKFYHYGALEPIHSTKIGFLLFHIYV